MELKTKIHAEEGKQDLLIVREFDLPIALLFQAYSEADLLEQWMGTKVIKLENKNHGSYQFETTNSEGKVVFRANGTIHQIITNQSITRTFEIENASFGVQLEFLKFEKLTTSTSKLTIHTVYRSVEDRDQLLRLPFAHGLNIAHNRLQEIHNKQK